MSTGTHIIETALAEIKAHSAIMTAPPETYSFALTKLNSMIAMWLKKGIDMGCAKLETHGDELYEPEDCTTAIAYNLALECATALDNGVSVVSQELKTNAAKGYQFVANFYKDHEIPKKRVSSTLPKGQGNKSTFGSPFFGQGIELDD